MRRWLPSGLLRPLVAALAISGRAGAQFDNDAGDISVHTTQLATSRAGYATYQVAVGFDTTKVEDVYALFGDESIAPINVPPAYQVSTLSVSLSLTVSLTVSLSLVHSRARSRSHSRRRRLRSVLTSGQSTRRSSRSSLIASLTASSPSGWTVQVSSLS